MGGIGLLFAMASLGLPGLGNFIAEFLTLAGTFKANKLFTCIASVGLVAATVYAIRFMQKVFYEKPNPDLKIKDLSIRESMVLGSLVIVILFLGLFPQTVLNTAKPAILKTLQIKGQSYERKTGNPAGSFSMDRNPAKLKSDP